MGNLHERATFLCKAPPKGLADKAENGDGGHPSGRRSWPSLRRQLCCGFCSLSRVWHAG